MPDKIDARKKKEGFQAYEELTQLAKEANIFVILELLTALYHSRDKVEERDRLNQAITHILVYSPWRKSQEFDTMCFELLDSINDSSLISRFFAVIQSLPLTYAKNPQYRHYASLSGQELLNLTRILIEQPTFRNNIGSYGCFIAHRYLQLCTDLLEICELNQQDILVDENREISHGAIWKSFLLSPPQLGDIPANYRMIQNDVQRLNLPLLPFFAIDDGSWLLSKEQLIDTLLCAYMQLLEHAYENLVCKAT